MVSDILYCCDYIIDCCDIGVGCFNIFLFDLEVWVRFISRKKIYFVVGIVFLVILIILRIDCSVVLILIMMEVVLII